MTSVSDNDKRGFQAFEVVVDRWCQAMGCLENSQLPCWKRTTNAMQCFDKLPLTGLPERWHRRINSCFLKINRIAAGYAITTCEDYQRVSEDDLARIQKALRNLLPRVRR